MVLVLVLVINVFVVFAVVGSRYAVGTRDGHRLNVYLFGPVTAWLLQTDAVQRALQLGMSKLPDLDDEVVGGVTTSERGKDMLGMQCGDLEPVLEHQGRAPLLDGDDLIKAHHKRRYPAQNVAAEAQVALGYVQPPVGQDLTLERTAVVLNEVVVVGHALEQHVEVAVPLLVGN